MSPLYLPYISPYLAPLHLEVALLQCGAHMLLVGLLLGLEGVLRVDLLLLEQHLVRVRGRAGVRVRVRVRVEA